MNLVVNQLCLVHVVLPITIDTKKLSFSRKISNLSRGKRKKYVYFS